MLNTSLHNPNVREKPTEDRFVRMCSGIDQGKDFPRELIAGYYRSIRNNPFKLPEEEDQAFGNHFLNFISISISCNCYLKFSKCTLQPRPRGIFVQIRR